MVLDATLLNTQHYKVSIKSKVKQSSEWRSALLLHLGVGSYWKGSLRATFDYGRQLYFTNSQGIQSDYSKAYAGWANF